MGHENHGQMKWAGKLDMEGYALFSCDQCERVVGLKPGKLPKTLVQEALYALHQAWVLPSMATLWDMEKPEGAENITVGITDAQIAETEPDDRTPVH